MNGLSRNNDERYDCFHFLPEMSCPGWLHSRSTFRNWLSVVAPILRYRRYRSNPFPSRRHRGCEDAIQQEASDSYRPNVRERKRPQKKRTITLRTEAEYWNPRKEEDFPSPTPRIKSIAKRIAEEQIHTTSSFGGLHSMDGIIQSLVEL